MILHPHFDSNEQGHLTIGGQDAVELARTFGTPAYIIDEDVIRTNCRTYLTAAQIYLNKVVGLRTDSRRAPLGALLLPQAIRDHRDPTR